MMRAIPVTTKSSRCLSRRMPHDTGQDLRLSITCSIALIVEDAGRGGTARIHARVGPVISISPPYRTHESGGRSWMQMSAYFSPSSWRQSK